MANIKFDLSQTVRQVEALGQAAGTLVGTLEQAMGRLSQLQSSMPVAAQASGGVIAGGPIATPGFTDKYADLRNSLTKQMQDALENEPNYKKWKHHLESGQAYELSTGHIRMANATGGTSPAFTRREMESGLQLANQARETMNQRARDDLAASIRHSYGTSYNSNQPSPYASNYMATGRGASSGIQRNMYGAGITGADIPRIMQGQQKTAQDLSGIEDSLRKMRDSDDKRERAIANELGRLVTRFEKVSDSFDKATERVESGMPISEAVRKAREAHQANVAGELGHINEQFSDLRGQSSTLSGGPTGGGGRMGLMQKVTRGLSIAGGLAGAGAAGVTAYMSTAQAIGQLTVGAERQATLAEGAVQGQAFRTVMSQLDTGKAENLMRFGGDLLFGEEFAQENRFLGRGGYEKALSLGIREGRHQRRLQSRQEDIAVLNAGMQVGTSALEAGAGAAATFGTGGLGAMFGAGFAASGMRGMSGGLQALGQARYGSQYAAFSGRLEDSYIAKSIAGPEALQEIPWVRRREMMQDVAQVQQRAEELQGAQLQRLAPLTTSYQRLLDIEQAEKQAVMLIGGGALTRSDITDIIFAPRQDKLNAARKMIPDAEETMRGQGPQQLNIALRAVESWKKRGKKLTEEELASGLVSMGPDETIMQGANQIRRNFGRIVSDKVREAYKPTMFEELEITPSESVLMHAQLANTLDMKPATDQAGKEKQLNLMANVTRLGRAGLGSFEQLTGNLGTIQSITGATKPEDSLQRLERVMAAAVAAGFDTSKTGQQFVQGIGSISSSLRTRDVEFSAGILGGASSLMSRTGDATPRDLADAAQGIATMESFSSRTGGYIGAMKAMHLVGAGGNLSDIAISGTRGVQGAQSVLNQIKRSGGKYSNIMKSSKVDPLVQESIESRSMEILQTMAPKGMSLSEWELSDREAYNAAEVKAQDQAVQREKKLASATIASSMETTRTRVSLVGKDLSKLMLNVKEAYNFGGKKGTGPRFKKAVRTAVHAITAANAQAELENPRAAAYADMQVLLGEYVPDLGPSYDVAGLDRKKKVGKKVFADVASQNMVSYMDNIITGMSGDVNRQASKEAYFKSLVRGGKSYTEGFDLGTIQAAQGGDEEAKTKVAQFFGVDSGSLSFGGTVDEFMQGISKEKRGAASGVTGVEIGRGQAPGPGQAKTPDSINLVGITDDVTSKLAGAIRAASGEKINEAALKAALRPRRGLTGAEE